MINLQADDVGDLAENDGTWKTEQELIKEFIIAGGLMDLCRCENIPHSASKTVKVSVKGVD